MSDKFSGFKEDPAYIIEAKSVGYKIPYFYFNSEVKRRQEEFYIRPIYVYIHYNAEPEEKAFVLICDKSQCPYQLWVRILDIINISKEHRSIIDYNFTHMGISEINIFAKFQEMDEESDRFHITIEENWSWYS